MKRAIVTAVAMAVVFVACSYCAHAQTGYTAGSAARAYGAPEVSYGYDDMGNRYVRQPQYSQTYDYQGTQQYGTGAPGTYGQVRDYSQAGQAGEAGRGLPAGTYQPFQAQGYPSGWTPSGYRWQGYGSVSRWGRVAPSPIYGSQPYTRSWGQRLSYGPGLVDQGASAGQAVQAFGDQGSYGGYGSGSYGLYSPGADWSSEAAGYNLWSSQIWDDGWQGRLWQDGRFGDVWVD